MGQNSVQITKTVDYTIVVPIATDFVLGQQRNGGFFGAAPTYKWQFNKAIKQSFWQKLASATWEVAKYYFASDSDFQKVYQAGGIEGYVSRLDGTTSSNNHADNLSSIKFGV